MRVGHSCLATISYADGVGDCSTDLLPTPPSTPHPHGPTHTAPLPHDQAGTCVSTISYAAGLSDWPELLPTLLTMLEGVDGPSVPSAALLAAEGALAALSKVLHLPRPFTHAHSHPSTPHPPHV